MTASAGLRFRAACPGDAHASHQAYNDVGVHQRGRAPRILQPCAPLQYRWCLPSVHGAPWWSKRMPPCPLGALAPSSSMHRWFPAVVTGASD
jgi:hypothetical protein